MAAIPRGRVATYGQIARLAGLGGQARRVGYALAALPSGSRVPWHRVVNAAGRISVRSGDRGMETLQRRMLEREGVVFGAGRPPAKGFAAGRSLKARLAGAGRPPAKGFADGRSLKARLAGATSARIDLARFRWRPRAYSSQPGPRGPRGARKPR